MAPERISPSFAAVPRPQAGERITISSQADARGLALEFSAADAQLERAGDNLIFTFGDGASVVLENFYQAYTKENVPDFSIDGTMMRGEDFFAALDESLAPAAGPAAAAAQNGGRFYNHDNLSLLGGIDALGGLDMSFGRTAASESTLIPGGTGLAAAAATEATADEVASGDNTPPPLDISALQALRLSAVDEAFLPDGTRHEEGQGAASGSTSSPLIGLPPGWSILDATPGHYGTLTQVNGQWTYTLSGSITHDAVTPSLGEGLARTDTLTLTVVDPYGRPATVKVTVDVLDDAPTIADVSPPTADVGTTVLEGQLDFDFGADNGAGKSLVVDGAVGVEQNGSWFFDLGSGATLTINGQGGFTYTAPGGLTQNKDLSVTIRDADGDTRPGVIKLSAVDAKGPATAPDFVRDAQGDIITDANGNASVNGVDNVVEGGLNVSNILTGDLSGMMSGVAGTPAQYNICVCVDVTSSMGKDFNGLPSGAYTEAALEAQRMTALKEYLGELLADIGSKAATGTIFNLKILAFDTNYLGSVAVDIPITVVGGTIDIAAVLDRIQVSGSTQGTQFNTALGAAENWFEQQTSGDNKLIFVTDADAAGYRGGVFVNGQMVDNNGIHSDAKESIDHMQKDPATGGLGVDVTAVVIGTPSNTDAKNILGDLFGKDGFTWVDDAGSLGEALNPSHFFPVDAVIPAGADLLLGGAAQDVLFGDSAMDALKAHIFQALGKQEGESLSKAEMLTYITAHPHLLAEQNLGFADDDGASDILVGGGGDDILFGQGGDDLLLGGGVGGIAPGSTLYGVADELGMKDAALALRNDETKLKAFIEDMIQELRALGYDASGQVKDNLDGLREFAGIFEQTLENESDGNNRLYGGTGNDVLLGGFGKDALSGGSGNDILIGGSDADILMGGKGNNILIGGSGGDTFVWWAGDLDGEDSILDFNFSDGDRLWFDGISRDAISWNFDEATGEATRVTISSAEGSKVIHLNANNGITTNNYEQACTVSSQDANSANEMMERIINDIKADTSS